MRPAGLFFEQARAQQVGILARVPLASGLLTGKLSADSAFAADDHRSFNRFGQAFDMGETFSGVPYEVGLQAVEELRPLVPPGVTMSQFALRWILMFDVVTCAIPGAKDVYKRQLCGPALNFFDGVEVLREHNHVERSPICCFGPVSYTHLLILTHVGILSWNRW